MFGLRLTVVLKSRNGKSFAIRENVIFGVSPYSCHLQGQKAVFGVAYHNGVWCVGVEYVH